MEIIAEAWVQYETGDSTSAKIRALRLAKDTYCKGLDYLKGMGMMPKAPEEAKPQIIIQGW